MAENLWNELCTATPADEVPDFDDNVELYDEHCILEQVTTLEEAERLKNISFRSDAYYAGPSDLYTHPGTSGDVPAATETKLMDQYIRLFKHSAVSSFFAYLPIYFWQTVVEKTNERLRAKKKTELTLDEMMKFLGILFYMSLVDKGGYEEYWGVQVEDLVLNNKTPSGSCLDDVMDLARFKLIRSNLSFREMDLTQDQMKKDPAARIRPLISMLKKTSPKYVQVGRNVSVDESTVACRSKYGRKLIVYNPKKPTGKVPIYSHE